MNIIDAVHCNNLEEVKRIVEENPKYMNILDHEGRTPLDVAITHGKLEIAQFLFEKGGQPNLEIYRDGNYIIPVHYAALSGYTATLKWAFENNVLSLDVLKVKDEWKTTPLDRAISHDKLEMAQFLFEKGGCPNLDLYRGGREWTPVHEAAKMGRAAILQWVFENNVLSSDVLKIKNSNEKTPMDEAIAAKQVKIAEFLRSFVMVDKATQTDFCMNFVMQKK